MTFCLELPKNVKKIISVLENAGYEAYAVGGCVRDAILGRIPQDWDVTTSATPEQVKSHFSHTVDTGIAHGTVTVLLGGGSEVGCRILKLTGSSASSIACVSNLTLTGGYTARAGARFSRPTKWSAGTRFRTVSPRSPSPPTRIPCRNGEARYSVIF